MVGHGEQERAGRLRQGLEARAQGRPLGQGRQAHQAALVALLAQHPGHRRRTRSAAYFPGAAQVDLVGASGYNFGARPPLLWSEPGALFGSAYTTIEALAAKPFWLAETGSGAAGGDKAGWITTLSTLQATSMPKLAGVVWYDVKDAFGDFRLRTSPVTKAFSALLKGACR